MVLIADPRLIHNWRCSQPSKTRASCRKYDLYVSLRGANVQELRALVRELIPSTSTSE
jgi:hypothetical protein